MKCAITSRKMASDLVNALQASFRDIKVILTIREDFVAQFGSLIRATESGIWHSWVKGTSKPPTLITIDETKFVKYVVETLDIVKELRKLHATHEVYEFIYERDILSNTFDRYYNLFDFLMLPRVPITWLKSRKVAPPPEKYIANYQQLRKLLDEIVANPERALLNNHLEVKGPKLILKDKLMSFLSRLNLTERAK